MSDPRKIILIRHGATKLNSNDVSVDRIRGWLDIPLSASGKEQAHSLAEKLKSDPPDVIVTSDLKRASETAKIISKAAGVPVSAELKELRPWNVGDLQGKLSKDVIPVLADYAVNKPTKKVPGGESFDDFRQRVFTGMDKVLDKYKGVVAIVTHHRVERLIKGWLAAGAKPDGKIDLPTFNKKGAHTGGAERLTYPEDKGDRVIGEDPTKEK